MGPTNTKRKIGANIKANTEILYYKGLKMIKFDEKEEQIFNSLYAKIKNREFNEIDVYAFLILIREHLPKNYWLFEFANLVAHRKRCKGSVFADMDSISKSLDAIGEDWMLNLICLKDGKSYIFAGNQPTKDNLQKLFESSFKGNVLTLPKFKLRKEIIKLAQTYNEPGII